MTGVPWSRRHPERYELQRHPDSDSRFTQSIETWLIKDDDVWSVHCMDCGIKLGVVNAGNERDAVYLTDRHQRDFHG